MSNSVTRRDFLAGATAAGLMSAPGISASRVYRANERVAVALIGCGGRGLDHCKSWPAIPDVEIVAVCDPDSSRAEAAAAAVEKASSGRRPRTAADFRKVLDDKSIDAVIVATCNHWHAPATIMACAAGKHVYCEKPCSHNPWEGEMMVAAARKHNRHVQMGDQRRSSASITEAIEFVRSGGIGKCTYAKAWYTNNRGTIGKGAEKSPPANLDYDLWQGPAPRKPFHDNYLHYTWHWFWHWGNGELGNNGVHMLDLCRWGLGADYPETVSSMGGRYWFQDDQETPDTNLATYVFPGGKMAVWEGLSCSKMAGGVPDLVFIGDKGSVSIANGVCTISDPDGKEIRKIRGNGGDKEHLVNFVDSIRSSAKLNSEIEEGHKSTMLSHLGNISYRTGRTINCDPKTGHIKDDREAMKYWKRTYEPGWEPRV